MKKIIKFRIYPESIYGFYFDAAIYPNVERMRKAASRAGGKTSNFDEAEAVTCGFRKGYFDADGKLRWTRTLGTLFFNRERLDAEVAAHEATHAAIRWMEEKGLRVTFAASALKDDRGGDCDDNEERFCYAVGRITNQIANAWTQRDK